MNSYGRGEDNRKKSGSSVVTRETFGMTLLFFSVILLLFAMIGPLVLGEIGVAISAFLLGTLGFFIYPFLLVTVYASIVLISGKNFLSGGLILRAMLVTIGAFLIAHLATGNKFFGSGFGSYMSGCWNAASVSAKDATAGGVVFGIVVYPFRALLTLPGAYIALSLLEVAALGFVLYQPIKQRMYRGQATGGAAVTDQGKRFDDLPEGKQGRLTVKEALGAVNDMKGIPDRVQKDEKPPVMPQKTQPAPVQQSYQGQQNQGQSYQGQSMPQPVQNNGQYQNGQFQNGQYGQNPQNSWQQPYQGQPYQGQPMQQPVQNNQNRQYQNGQSQNGQYGQEPQYGTSGVRTPPPIPQDPWQQPYQGQYSQPAQNSGQYQNGTQNGQYGQPSQARGAQKRKETTKEELYDRYGWKPEAQKEMDARTFLFTRDPSNDYYTNLAYGEEYYRGRERRSTVSPVKPIARKSDAHEPVQREYPVRPVQREYPTYSESYGKDAEQEQPRTPRNIVEQKPDARPSGFSVRHEDVTYTNVPKFDPPKDEPKPEPHDEPKFETREEPKFGRDRDVFDRDSEPRDREFGRSDDSSRDRDMFDREEKPERDVFGRDDRLHDDRLSDDRLDNDRLSDDRLGDDRMSGDRDRDGFGRSDDSSRDRDMFDRDEKSDRDVFGRDDRLHDDRLSDDRFSDDRLGNDRLSDDRLGDDRMSGDRDTDGFGRGDDSSREAGGDFGELFSDDFRGRGRELGSDRDFSSDRDFLRRDGEPDAQRDFPSDRDLNADRDFDSDDTRRDFGADEPQESAGDEPGRDDGRGEESFASSGFLDEPQKDRRIGFGGAREELPESRAINGLARSDSDLFENDGAEDNYPATEEEMPEKPKKHVYRPYVRPNLGLLRQYDDTISVPQEEIDRNSRIIIDTLAGFRVDADVLNVVCGPSVTRYDINIPNNVSVGTVTKRSGEIAMRLHAANGVNMYANNEKGMISIEVPNKKRATVGLSSIMQADEYVNAKPGSLVFAIGKDIEGRARCGDIPKMTHILVAGATNAGKSVALNAMLVSLICKYSPEELRLILVDPKRTEFIVYDGLPHLMINEIISEAPKAVMALNWSIKEMERRFTLFEQKTRSGIAVRNIDEYNQNLTEDEERLPKIVFVVDELADLMSHAKKEIEERIQRLTQKARAAGIHLVLATQRPSVDVITGVIKGNLPTRMAVRVIQEVDSRTILDESGAEKLLGNGDMLYKTGGMFSCLRVQGAFIDSAELQAIVEDIKAHNESYFDSEATEYINHTEEESGDEEEDDGDNERARSGDKDLNLRALSMVVKLGSASISLIQRRFGVGYNHAGNIMEWMESMGYVSPFDGKAKARTVLLTKEEYESKYGPLDP